MLSFGYEGIIPEKYTPASFVQLRLFERVQTECCLKAGFCRNALQIEYGMSLVLEIFQMDIPIPGEHILHGHVV